jgi:NAD(P)-dependent dehydrogenase (short-subunit alcohol dehydrogenase family)
MKNAMIWGANGAIGSALVDKLQAEDWNTIAVVRDAGDVTTHAETIFETSFDNPDQIEHMIYLVSQEFGNIEFWVYAAGDILSAKVEDMDPKDWDRILSANLANPFYALHYSLPLLSERAHIFFIGAVSERLRLPGLSAYAASKSGLEAFAEALRKEQRNKHISVVRPGAVNTTFWDKVPMRLPADAAAPEKVAEKIYEAYNAGHKGLLDLF